MSYHLLAEYNVNVVQYKNYKRLVKKLSSLTHT